MATETTAAEKTAEADAKATKKAMTGVDVGDQVHYVWPDSGHHHAAFVANVLDPERGYVTLSVLDHNGGFMQSPWVEYDAGGAPGTWHPKDHADEADKLDPAGLNVEPGGRTPVPQGTQGEVAVDEPLSDEERAARAIRPRFVAKDDPVGHRTADVAKATDTVDTIDRSAFTETASERAHARVRDGQKVSTEPAARNAANEPSARRAHDLAAQDATRTASSAERARVTETGARATETGTRTGTADREANRSTERNSAQTDKKD